MKKIKFIDLRLITKRVSQNSTHRKNSTNKFLILFKNQIYRL